VRLAVKRAKDEDIDGLLAFLDATRPDPGDRWSIELVELDETFHERLMAMSDNAEMLRNVNARIRFVRWIDMDRINRADIQAEHCAVLHALKGRDEGTCVYVLERRLDTITSAIKEGYAQIDMPSAKSAAREGAR
jgi:DNA-binding GntR family transcriptional regulator